MFYCAALYALSPSPETPTHRVHGFFDLLHDAFNTTPVSSDPNPKDPIFRNCLLIYEEIRYVYAATLSSVYHYNIPLEVLKNTLQSLHPIVHSSRFRLSVFSEDFRPGPNLDTIHHLFEDMTPRINSLKNHETRHSYISDLWKAFPKECMKWLGAPQM